MDRIRGLDSIRIICALWVVMGHFGGPPITAGVDRTTTAGWLVGGLYNNFWNGPAAVIVFFVISGFCIHYPFSKTLKIPSLAGYLSRRYFRIGIPLGTVLILFPVLGFNLDKFNTNILWSLVAELFYYTFYPFFFGSQAGAGFVAVDDRYKFCHCSLPRGDKPNGEKLLILGFRGNLDFRTSMLAHWM